MDSFYSTCLLYDSNFRQRVPENVSNKKSFQLNANRPLTDSMGYILNRFEHVFGEGGIPVCCDGDGLG